MHPRTRLVYFYLLRLNFLVKTSTSGRHHQVQLPRQRYTLPIQILFIPPGNLPPHKKWREVIIFHFQLFFTFPENSSLTFEFEKWLKVKVDEVGLLLRHLYGYNSVCFLKPVAPLRLPGRLNLVRIGCCFENTRHLTQTKGRSLDQTEAPPLKVLGRGLIVQSEHFF